jgi:heme exporter protein C
MPLWTPLALLVLTLALLVLHLAWAPARTWVWKVLAGLGLAMLASGAWLGLAWAPPEREMGDVYRIIYAHVPQVWMGLLAFTLNFGCSVAYLMKKSWTTDAISEAAAEVGLLFGGVGVLLGAIWGKPTWGVWWDWDPRLTTAAIMLVVYSGYVALRKFVEDPDKRATWSAVVGIIAFVDLPILWYSVQWWRSLHQPQSTPQTVDPAMTMVLRWNAVAFLCLMIVFIWQRYRIAIAHREREVALPAALPEDGGAPVGAA